MTKRRQRHSAMRLAGDAGSVRGPIDLLLEKLDDNEYLADIFLILHFDELPQPSASSFEGVQLLVPQSIDDLFMNRAVGSDEIIAALVTWARPKTRSFSAVALSHLVSELRARYAALRQWSYVSPIPDESDPDIAATLSSLLPASPMQTSIIQRMKEAARNSITTVLSYSKRTGKAILMRGRDLVRLLRDRVVQLELPSGADGFIKKKTELTCKLFAFRGGVATKFFVGIALAVAGLFAGEVGSVANVAGLAFAFVDP